MLPLTFLVLVFFLIMTVRHVLSLFWILIFLMKVCLKKAHPSQGVLWYRLCAFSVEGPAAFSILNALFQGLTSPRPKLKHTYHKGVQHMHSSWKLHCDMKDIQALSVILRMSKPWPFRCPTWGKRTHGPQNFKLLNHGSRILKPLIPTELEMFDDVCDWENSAQCWIGGGQLAWWMWACAGTPVAQHLVLGGRCRIQGWAALSFCLPAPPPHVIQAQGSGSGGSPWHENFAQCFAGWEGLVMPSVKDYLISSRCLSPD